MMHITIIGSGAFALSLAHLLSKSGRNILHIWTHDEDWKKKVEKNGYYELFDQQFSLSHSVFIYTDLAQAIKNSSILFIAVSSSFFDDIVHSLSHLALRDKVIYIGTKGMIHKKPFFLSSYMQRFVKAIYIGCFAGPNLAQDIFRDAPVSMLYSFHKKGQKELIETIFPSSLPLHFFSNPKPIELSSVMKNIYAIGSGIILELTSSQSTNLSFLSFSFMELTKAMNFLFFLSNPFFADLLGDFFLTGTMQESRNLSFGRAIVRNESDYFLKHYTVEGYQNLEAAMIFFKTKNVIMPIFEQLYSIIKNESHPKDLLSILFFH